MEGWARSTQGRDASSHIFRFGATAASDTLALILQPPPARRPRKAADKPAAPRESAPAAAAPRPAPPKLKLPKLPKIPQLPQLDQALDAVNQTLERLPGTVQQLLEGGQPGASSTEKDLLDFLLKP